jgi:hypothetical protein
MEPWRAVDSHNRGVEAHNGLLEGLYSVDQWLQIRTILMRSRIQIRIKVKSWFRIHIRVVSGSAFK